MTQKEKLRKELLRDKLLGLTCAVCKQPIHVGGSTLPGVLTICMIDRLMKKLAKTNADFLVELPTSSAPRPLP